jgi:hypothetical protein
MSMTTTIHAAARQRRRRVLLVVLSTLAFIGLSVAPAGADDLFVPAAAAIDATPSTDLLDGDIVTVSGTGFPAGAAIVIVQCLAGAGQAGCNLSQQTFVTADGAGAFSSGFRVSRLMYIGGVTDCADPGACIIGAGVPPDGSAGSAGVAIQFDPDVPLPPPPTLDVVPSSDLVDRQVVMLAGSGFPSGVPVAFVQCLTAGEGPSKCDLTNQAFGFTDDTGDVVLYLRVARILGTPDGSADCAVVGACYIGGGTLPDGSAGSAVAPISFDPDAPPAPPASATVTPATGLTDGQTVRVDGAGFLPESGVALIQCATAAVDARRCDTSTLLYATADASGGFSTAFTVHRYLETADGRVDCAEAGACKLGLASTADVGTTANVALEFASASTPPTPTTTSATPGSRTAVTPRFTG